MVAAVGGLYQDYSCLNGIAGTYNMGSFSSLNNSLPLTNYSLFGGYGYNTNINQAKQNLQNNYEYNSMYQAYNNKQGYEALDLATNLQSMQALIAEGRIDDAMQMYDGIANSMKAMGIYEGSEAQIKSLLASEYSRYTGSNLRADLENNASGSLIQGIKQGIPILGTFFANENSKEEAIAKVTNEPESKGSKVAEVAGSLVSGVGSGAGIGALVGGGVPGAIVGGIVGGVLSIGKMIFGKN